VAHRDHGHRKQGRSFLWVSARYLWQAPTQRQQPQAKQRLAHRKNAHWGLGASPPRLRRIRPGRGRKPNGWPTWPPTRRWSCLIPGLSDRPKDSSPPAEPWLSISGPVAARGWTPCSKIALPTRRTRDSAGQPPGPDWESPPLPDPRAPPRQRLGSQQSYSAGPSRRLLGPQGAAAAHRPPSWRRCP